MRPRRFRSLNRLYAVCYLAQLFRLFAWHLSCADIAVFLSAFPNMAARCVHKPEGCYAYGPRLLREGLLRECFRPTFMASVLIHVSHSPLNGAFYAISLL